MQLSSFLRTATTVSAGGDRFIYIFCKRGVLATCCTSGGGCDMGRKVERLWGRETILWGSVKLYRKLQRRRVYIYLARGSNKF